MISAPLRVSSAPKASAVGGSSSLFSGASSVSVESKKSKPSRIKIRCAAATAAAPAVGNRGAGAAATLYEVLGLRAGATGREIKAAYRRLARERHPDVAGPAPGAAAEFVRIHDAYATLSDPDTRARYDRGAVPAVAQRPWSSSGGGGGVYGRPRRTWETDQCW